MLCLAHCIRRWYKKDTVVDVVCALAGSRVASLKNLVAQYEQIQERTVSDSTRLGALATNYSVARAALTTYMYILHPA